MLGLTKKPEVYPTETRQWVDTERAWGGRPTDTQLDGIKNAGVMTLIHLREDGQPVEADQQRIELRGMYYVSVPFAQGRIDADQTNDLLDILLERQNGPFYIFDEDGAMASVMALLFMAVPNFWQFDRYQEEATRRGIALDSYPQLEASITAYMRRYIRGRR